MVKLQGTMNAYVKWLTQRDHLAGEKGVPTAVVGRTMIAHGEDFDRDSQFGNCLIEMGRANEQVANIQEQYANDATKYWLDSLERSVAMMKEYQVCYTHYLVPLSSFARIHPFLLSQIKSSQNQKRKGIVPNLSSCS